jgi:hypothetical protein
MSTLRDGIESYVKRVKDLADHLRGTEQTMKQSLIGPFFTMLGYDLTDPRECLPEYRADFGKERSVRPVVWGFKVSGTFAFFVEAEKVGTKGAGSAEQLADCFAKETTVKLGVLTNGAQWRFFTDIVNANVMDKQPFATWDIMADEPPPFDVITLLQKSQFNPELIRAFAQRQRAQNLLVSELNRLLEPSTEFTRLAVANIETRNLTASVVESWKPIVANAVNEWAKQRTLHSVLSAPSQAAAGSSAANHEQRIQTTEAELAAFEAIKAALGPERPIAYEDSAAYFKVHLAERRTWVFARLQLDRRNPTVAVPLAPEQVSAVAGDLPVTPASTGWTSVTIPAADRVGRLAELFRKAYESVRLAKAES